MTVTPLQAIAIHTHTSGELGIFANAYALEPPGVTDGKEMRGALSRRFL